MPLTAPFPWLESEKKITSLNEKITRFADDEERLSGNYREDNYICTQLNDHARKAFRFLELF